MSFAANTSTGLLALAGTGIVVLAIGMLRGESSVRTYFDLRKSRGVLQETVDGLKAENSTLAEEILRLKRSPSYAKKVLRDKYHVIEEDEDIIFFAE